MNKQDMLNKYLVSSKNTQIIDIDGDKYNVRPLSGTLRNEFLISHTTNASSLASKDTISQSVGFLYKAIIHSLLDDEGNQIFADKDINEVKELKTSFTTELFSKIIEVSGLIDKQEDEAEKKD